MKKNDSEHRTQYMPIGMCLGMSIGMAIGAAMDNISIGMCLGIGVGVCIGSAIDASQAAKSNEKDQQETDTSV